MYRNNFNHSDTGTDIEFSGCYSIGLSQDEFDENFKRIVEGHKFSSVIYYRDWGNIKSAQNIGDIFRLEKGTKKADILDRGFFYNESFNDIRRELLGMPLKDYEDFEDILTLKDGIEIYETRGYCQGDFCKVIIDKNALKKCWGNEPDIKALEDEIDHLCWDCPVSATLTINGTEYFYDEYTLDRYDWQREEFAEKVSKDSGVAVETLLAILPEHLDYN